MDIDSLLQPFQRFGVHLGLSRIVKLLANLGNPHHQVPIIHVAGTNGKGSVCAYLSSVLTQAGYRTGRYTSPHLVNWTERICLNEQAIASLDLCKLIQQVQGAINPDEELPTQFEVITAAAWLYFAQQKVDIAVIEVGLGGRLDATNVCLQPLVTIITSISREHWQQLGPTVADIATEKAGIIKPGCPVVIGPLPPEAEQVVRSRILQLKCPLVTPQPARQIDTGWAEYQGWGRGGPHGVGIRGEGEMGRWGRGGPQEVGIRGEGERGGQGDKEISRVLNSNLKSKIQNPKSIKYPLPLQGQIQLTNSALALAALEILQQQGWEISPEAIVNGMAKTKWLGRMQWITWKNHKILVDGAHNPAAAQALRDYVNTLEIQTQNTVITSFEQSKIQVSWVMGMLSTKEHDEIFKALLRSRDKLYLVPVPDHNSANPEDLAKLAQNICPELSFCQTYPELSTALETAIATTDNLVVLCGSLYLIGHFFGTANQLGVLS